MTLLCVWGNAMGQKIAIVTDSTAELPAGLVRRFDVRVVPLSVVVDAATHQEGATIDHHGVLAALHRKAKVSTSRPSPGVFLDVYEACADAGADQIVSVHLSGELSGTCDAARLASWDSPIPVTVVDTGLMSWGLGRSVLAGARERSYGHSVEQVVASVRSMADRCRVLFYVDSLEYLWRGGRIGTPNALVGTALNIKPLLHMMDGKIAALERPRMRSRALVRLVEVAAEVFPAAVSGEQVVNVDVVHCAAATRAQQVAASLHRLIAAPGQVQVQPASAVLAAHTGPGTIGVVLSPAR